MIYKYQVENELKSLKEVSINYFRKNLDKDTKDMNKIIFFKNKDQEYSSYYCTFCKHWHFRKTKEIKHFSRKDFLRCGSCGNRFEVIYPRNNIPDYENYYTTIEANERNELIIRQFFYKKTYKKKYGDFDEELLEIERINVNRNIEMKKNSYTCMGKYKIYHADIHNEWKRDRAQFWRYYPYSNVITKPSKVKRLICNNLMLKYSVLDLAVKYHIDIVDYIKLYLSNDKVELLMKNGCINFVSDICRYSVSHYNYERLLNSLDKQGMKLLAKYNLAAREVEQYNITKSTDYKLLKKAAAMGFVDSPLISNLEKTINYLYKHRYNPTDYNDYLDCCLLLGRDLKNKDVLFPSNLTKAHDEAFSEKKKYEEKIYTKGIKDYSIELANLNFEEKGLLIRVAESQEELINESKVLEHCVRSYAKKMATRKTAIFFIRKKKEIEKPYVTLELVGNKVIQCRGFKNNVSKPLNDEVKEFVNDWCNKFELLSCFK